MERKLLVCIGLACFEKISEHQTNRIRKECVDIFKSKLLINIACDTILKIVNFLDVNLNLSKDKYQSYSKPRNSPNI